MYLEHKPPDGWEQVSFCDNVRAKLRSPDWFSGLIDHQKSTSGSVFIEGDEVAIDGSSEVGMFMLITGLF